MTIAWAGRLATVGATTTEIASIQAAYDDSVPNVQAALDSQIEATDNATLLTMLQNWRTGSGPFAGGLPGGGLPFGSKAAILTGNPADDTMAISAGTGAKIGVGGGGLQPTNNLSDVADAGSSRANLHVPALTPAAVVTTTNLVALSGLQTIDGYTLLATDLVLLVGQTTASQNGLWAASSGSWTRPTEFPTGGVVKGRTCTILNGTLGGGSLWILQTNATLTIDTSSQTWVKYSNIVSASTSGISGTLTSALTNGTAGVTSLPVAVTAPIQSGVAITLVDPSGTMSLWKPTAPANPGDAQISVQSETVAGNYAVGSQVYAYPVVSVPTPNVDRRYRLNGGGVRFACSGASYSQGNGSPDSTTFSLTGGAHLGDGWFPKLCQLSNGRIMPIINNSIGGDTTDGVLSRIGQICAANVDFCVFDQFLRNEIANAGYSLTTMMNRVDQIVKALRSAGVQPMFTSTLNAINGGASEQLIAQGNRYLAAYCAANGVFFVDASSVISDPTNLNGILAQYASGTAPGHPNEAGHMLLAQTWWTAVQTVIPYGSFLLPYDDTDPYNLLPHGCFASMSGSGAPTGWSSTGPGTAAFSYAPVAGVIGQALTIQRLAANGTTGLKGITVSIAQGAGTFSPGDTVVFMGRLASATLAAQGAAFDAFVTMTSGSAPNQIYTYKNMGVDWASPSAWYQQGVVTPGTTALAVTVQLDNGTGTAANAQIVVGQLGLYNLSKMGIAY